jgi:hypothetical protein
MSLLVGLIVVAENGMIVSLLFQIEPDLIFLTCWLSRGSLNQMMINQSLNKSR